MPLPEPRNADDLDVTDKRLNDLENLAQVNGVACEEERTLWMAVKGKHPGQPGHDVAAWSAWTVAARRVQALCARLAWRKGAAGRQADRRSPEDL